MNISKVLFSPINYIKPFCINYKFITRTFIRFGCWSCGSQPEVSKLFCEQCNSLQKPNPKANYFSILDISESYDLNEGELARKYKEMQRFLHPDKFGTRLREEQDISAEYSSLVNDAYKTLLDPLSRGVYMLGLKGLELPEETQLDKEFLMEIMERNERVEEAESKEEILDLQKENKKIIQDLTKNLSKAFFAGDMDAVKNILAHMKYYTSIDNQIKGVIRQKGIIE